MMKKSGRINENYLFVQAYGLYCDARKAEKCDYIRAINLYRQALSLIDSILERFPSSSLALMIAQRKFRIGRSTYESIKKRIEKLRAAAWRQEMLEILHDCAKNISQTELCCEKLASLAGLFLINRQPARALAVVNEAAELAERISDPVSRGHTLSAVAVSYAGIGEYERAVTLSAFFPDTMDQVRLLTSLGCVYYEKKLRDRARQMFISAIDTVERSKELEVLVTGRAWIAFKLGESGEYYWAFEVAETVPDEEVKLSIMHQIVDHLIASGKFASIVEIGRKIEDSLIRAELAVSLVMKHIAEGFFSQARDAAAGIAVPFLRARAYLAIASEYKDRAAMQVVYDLINEAVKLVETLKDVPEKILILTQAASVYFKFKQEAKIRELMQRAFNLSQGQGYTNKDSEFVSFLLKKCLEFGQIELANDLLEQIGDARLKDLAVIEIVGKHASLDNFQLARTLADSLQTNVSRCKAYLRVIADNPENRNYQEKINLLNLIVSSLQNKISTTDKDAIMSQCSLLLARYERFHLALQLQEKIESDVMRDELLWQLAEMKINSNAVEEGSAIVRLIKDHDRRIARMIELGCGIFEGRYANTTFTAGDFLSVAFSFWLDEKERLETES
ncbi:MAG: hypothetical protein GX569_06380, partial [Candidatus Riflebacteria bacterium]|nr:hypothetical protein [Candidatus Riflebacteria bacterium]